MIELFPNVREDLRAEAETAWILASSLTPNRAVNFLEAYTAYNHTEEEQEYLRFYFNTRMESKENG